jgi:hypothetical protein
MTVTILKHHEGYEPAQKVEVEESLGRYWIAVGVATVIEPDNRNIDSILSKQLKKTKKKK